MVELVITGFYFNYKYSVLSGIPRNTLSQKLIFFCRIRFRFNSRGMSHSFIWPFHGVYILMTLWFRR